MQQSEKCLTPFQRNLLQRTQQQENLKLEYRRRIDIMLLADQGYSQTEICRKIQCSQSMARHWIAIAKAGLAHQWADSPIGRPKAVDDAYIERLQDLIQCSPRECGYPFQRWTARSLAKHLQKELNVTVSDRHLRRLLKSQGLSTRRQAISLPATQQKILIQDLCNETVGEPSAVSSLLLNLSITDSTI
jgi:transposase